ncbi:MAG: class I SAM-dependent methyltransferase [Capsulimonadaceae bacterium]|nr:class I SAM-dependent methyltransferase [Capsulimonadaceae bacterium]
MGYTSKRDFDKDAATWDDNPARVSLMGKVAEALMANVAIDEYTAVLDYGAGTGLVSFALAPYAGSVTAADSSEGMLAKLREKALSSGLETVSTLLLDLEHQPVPESRFDVVVSTMVMHHIDDAAGVIARLALLLKNGGCLAIADLDSDGGDFHADPAGVAHNGFERDEMKQYFRDAGLADVCDVTAVTFRKDVPGKGLRPFSIFLITGRII